MSAFDNVDIIHDYSALNRAADFERNRKDGHLLALDRHTRLYATLAKGAAVAGVILATGIAMAIVLWSLDLQALTAPPITREAEVPPIVREAEKAAEAASEVTNFALFRNVPSGLDGYADVVTGSRFASSTDVKPEAEWCYIERRSVAGADMKLDLAEVPQPGRDAEPIGWSDQALTEMGLSRMQATELLTKCRFISASLGPQQSADMVSDGEGGVFLVFNGDITKGFAGAVRTLFAEHPDARGLKIESAGGLVAEALDVGRWLRAQGKSTMVTGECNSACVLVFAGGAERIAHPNARFGVHQAFFGTDDAVTGAEAQTIIGELLTYYIEAGIDPAVLIHGLSTAHEDITIFNANEALTAKLATQVAVVGEK